MSSKADKTLLLDTSQPETRKQVYEAIRALEGCYTIDLTRKRWRVGDGQRGYYWGYLVTEVSKLVDKSREQTDKVLNAMFLSEPWEVAGQPLTVVRSLSDLDPAGAAQYFGEVAAWVFNTYGVRLDAPDPSKRKAERVQTNSPN